MQQSRIKIYGPPGTGKTTYCIDLLCEHLQAGDRVLFLSFTRAAKLEAYERLVRLFGAVPESATVSTLHALCLKILNIGVECLADRPNNMKKFMSLLGVTEHHRKRRGLVYSTLGFYGFLRNIESNWECQQDAPPFTDPENAKELASQFDQWKAREGYVDFTDLLVRVAKGEGQIPGYDVVIIDEAQDLTTLQWRVCDRLYEKAATVYVVGDDDQAVYSFLGADVSRFLCWPADAVRVLDKSYRLPQNILEYSQLLAKQIKFRQEKQVRGTDRTGHILKDIYLNECLNYGYRASEMYLCRNEYMLRRVAKLLIAQGMPFKGPRSPFTDRSYYPGRVFTAISLLHVWRDRPLELKEWKTLKAVLTPKLSAYIVDKYPGATELNVEGIPPLRQIFKNEDFDAKGWWSIFFPTLNARLEAGFKLALDNFPLDRCLNPTLELSTIHGAKGKEADRVYVCSALTERLYRQSFSRDDEHRLFYVAVTRARDELFIMHDEQAGVREYQFPKL